MSTRASRAEAEPAELRTRVEEQIRRHDLIAPGGEVLALVSGGADSTCMWHALRALGYSVSALHVNHGLRGAESDEDARFCREALGAEVVDAPVPANPAARHGPHSVGPGRDRYLQTGLERHGEGDQAEAGGRRRPPAAHALARRDGGLLPRRGAPLSQ
jgi:3'-phosphoadenosine 5'-phosphosulfate sulfotransferase (PAPS reductase)/FAD synthetase